MSSTAIPCQKFNTADELKTLSRSVLSGDARRMLGVLDSAMRKILLVFALENTNITYLVTLFIQFNPSLGKIGQRRTGWRSRKGNQEVPQTITAIFLWKNPRD